MPTASMKREEATRLIRLLIVDDHVAIRIGLTSILEAHGISVIGAAASGRDALAILALRLPDIILVDLRMQGMDGMQGMSMKDMKSRDPSVDMRVMQPSRALDDPGPRLRDNGRRELTYADLHTIGSSKDLRGATREIQLHLTGNMQRFIWGFDGKKFSQAEPLHFDHGERLRIVLSNDTMMAHPIHLHGMFGELEAANGEVMVRKHTFIVQPSKQLSYLVTANSPGRWAYHCHLLYHMEAGMFREVVVA